MKIYVLWMARCLTVLGVLFLLIPSLCAQPVTVKGVIKTFSGEPFFNVSVKALAEKKEVFTDPDGLFMIEVSPLSEIKINFPGYIVSTIKVGYSGIDTTIVLQRDKSGSVNTDAVVAERNAQDLQSAFQGARGNLNIYGSGINPSSSLLPVFSQKENTEGSRYLNNDWRRGYVVNTQQTLINNPSFFYNYDKITGELLLSQDKRTAIAIGREQVSSFCIIGDGRDSLVFKIIPQINDQLYAALLVDGSLYRLYRVTQTKLNKADYHTDGMTETGNKYDEYADTQSYYLQSGTATVYQKLRITRKGLQNALPKTPATKEFFSSHNLDPVDEVFVKGLIIAANHP